MTISTHLEYLRWRHALTYRASRSPDCPWAKIDIDDEATGDAQASRWLRLAEWTRQVESPFNTAGISRPNQLAKLLVPEVDDFSLPTQIWARLIDFIQGAQREDAAFAAEIVTTGLREALRVPAPANEPKLLPLIEHLLGACKLALDEANVARTALAIIDRLSTEAAVTHVAGLLPASAGAIDRAEADLRALRQRDDSRSARMGAEELLKQLTPEPIRVAPETPPGSEVHRTALLRLGLLQEISFRAYEVDDVEGASGHAHRAFLEAIENGVPGASEVPPHDLAGFDRAAQVAGADWLYGEMARDARVGWEVLVPRPDVTRALRDRNSVLRGRYRTEYDAFVQLHEGAANAMLKPDVAEAIRTIEVARNLAMRIRCFALCSAAFSQRARILLRKAQVERGPEEKAETLLDAVDAGALGGENDVVKQAARDFSEIAPSEHGVLGADLGTIRRSERVCQLLAMRETMPLAKDAELPVIARSVAQAMIAGPFSMNSRYDVQRTAVAVSSAVLREAAGLAEIDQFNAIAETFLSAFEELTTDAEAPGHQHTWMAASDVLGEVLKLPSVLFSETLVTRLLEFAARAPKDRRLIAGDAWINFVRPAIEVVMRGAAPAERLAALRDEALRIIPDWHAEPEGEGTSDDPAHPGTRYELLPMVYRAMLGSPPPEVELGDVVHMMIAYCAHYADGTKTRGLRHPLDVQIALHLADYAPAGLADALLDVLARMALEESLNNDTRVEVIVALTTWARRMRRRPDAGVTWVKRAAPEFLARACSALKASVTPTRTEDDESDFFRVDPSQVVGALVVLTVELIFLLNDDPQKTTAKVFDDFVEIVMSLTLRQERSIQGSARNVASYLLLWPALDPRRRDRLGVIFLSSLYQTDVEIVIAALHGFRGRVISETIPLEDGLLELIAGHLAERARLGSNRRVRTEAKLTLHALYDAILPDRRERVLARVDDIALSDGDKRVQRLDRRYNALTERGA